MATSDPRQKTQKEVSSRDQHCDYLVTTADVSHLTAGHQTDPGVVWHPMKKHSEVPHLMTDQMVEVDRNWGVRADQAAEGLPEPAESLPADLMRVGELYLADISVPLQLYASPELGLEVEPLFARDDILRIR